MVMWNLITTADLTPNQFYMLYFMKNNISPVHVNIHQELRAVIAKGYINDLTSGAGQKYELTPKAHSAIDQVESLFRVQKKKTDTQIMGDDYQAKIKTYLELFPKIRLPSGKAARSDKKNVETAMRWFQENYEYDWDTILRATEAYVIDYQMRNYKFMQTSQYFIRKQNSDKTWASELANWCSDLVNDNVQNSDNYFSENVK